MSNSEKMIDTFSKLGKLMSNFQSDNNGSGESSLQQLFNSKMTEAAQQACQQNGWFTKDNIAFAIRQWGQQLSEEYLNKWLAEYNLSSGSTNSKKVAVVMAGNIPMVGFHDLLCVLISGNELLAKNASQDSVLIPAVVDFLIQIDPEIKNRVTFTQGRLEGMDAVIATGSNNSARYFEYYFGKYPHIIRKNRSSVAVLNGDESKEEMEQLGNDVFQYFGLGCRNVSKLFVPEGFNFDLLFGGLFPHADKVMDHHKYINNFDYHKAIFMMNKDELLENGFVLLKEDISMHSPVATLYYEYYKDQSNLSNRLKMDADQIQCVVTKNEEIPGSISFGQTQQPSLWDYADQVDTMKFLLGLN